VTIRERLRWLVEHPDVRELLVSVDEARELLPPVEAREGLATVYDHEGRYVGCIGIDTWWRLVAEEADRVAAEAAPADDSGGG
jgi:hypothetical protein